MSALDDLAEELQKRILEQARTEYSETVVAHWLNPRNPYPMEHPDGYGKITGPCGDTMEIFIRVRDGKIFEASFLTDGCITSIVSGSMAVELAADSLISEARTVSKDDILDGLDGLPEESQHCALLASNTLRAAIDDYISLEREPWKRPYRSIGRK